MKSDEPSFSDVEAVFDHLEELIELNGLKFLPLCSLIHSFIHLFISYKKGNFYLTLKERLREWSDSQLIGDCFISLVKSDPVQGTHKHIHADALSQSFSYFFFFFFLFICLFSGGDEQSERCDSEVNVAAVSVVVVFYCVDDISCSDYYDSLPSITERAKIEAHRRSICLCWFFLSSLFPLPLFSHSIFFLFSSLSLFFFLLEWGKNYNFALSVFEKMKHNRCLFFFSFSFFHFPFFFSFLFSFSSFPSPTPHHNQPQQCHERKIEKFKKNTRFRCHSYHACSTSPSLQVPSLTPLPDFPCSLPFLLIIPPQSLFSLFSQSFDQ